MATRRRRNYNFSMATRRSVRARNASNASLHGRRSPSPYNVGTGESRKTGRRVQVRWGPDPKNPGRGRITTPLRGSQMKQGTAKRRIGYSNAIRGLTSAKGRGKVNIGSFRTRKGLYMKIAGTFVGSR